MDNLYISSITKLLLEKYNKDFDERKNEAEKIDKNCEISKKQISQIMKAYITDLNKLNSSELFELTKLEQPNRKINENKMCDFTENFKKIQNISFIQDINLLKKIIEYRKYEIKKEIILTKYYFAVYNNIISKILNLNYKNFVIYNNIPQNENSSLNVFNYTLGEINNEKNTYYNLQYKVKLDKLISYKDELEGILENIFLKNKEILLKKTLCKYVFLQDNLNKFTKNII
jgi:hypothetical protein